MSIISQKTCLRCGNKWFPKRIIDPLHCPKCKSPYWNKKIVRINTSRIMKKRGKKQHE